MQRHKILHKNSIWENHGQERKNSLFQEVIVNSAELELCGSLKLHRDSDLRRRILWIFRVWSLLFSDGWFLWRSVGGICLTGEVLASYFCWSPNVYIPGESSMAVWVMWISITTWSACCDSFITAWIIPLIVKVISVKFYKSLRWSRSHCNVWNVRWSDGVTDSMNVGGYQWGRLLRQSCWGHEGLILERRCSRKEERPRGSGFLGRMSVFGAVDSSEKRVSSGKIRRCSQGETLLGISCCLSSGVSDEMWHVSWSWCRSEIDHTTACFYIYYIETTNTHTYM